MRFRNPAKRIWSTSWMRSTGLEASCSFHWTQILWQGFWISPPLKPQLFHNKRQNSTKVFTHPAQAEDMQWVRELSSRLVFSNSAAFTLDRERYKAICGIHNPPFLWCLTTCHMLKGPQDSPRLLSAIARWKKEPRAISQTCTFGQQPLHSPKIPPWATIFLRKVQNLEIKLRNLKASAAPSTLAS